MEPEAPSQLPADIAECASRIVELVTKQGAQLKAMRASRTQEDVMRNYTEAMGTQCGIIAEAQKLKSWVSAAQSTGVVAKASVSAVSLELHPAHPERLDRAEELFLASLHRAGDHSLDRESEEVSR